VGYDAAWPSQFLQERGRIRLALGERALRVDHVGSTSVPGLSAKPIIDIDVSVIDADDEPDFLPALEAAGYRLRIREEGHRMLRTADDAVHVHVCSAGSEWERRHLLFRDWLRMDPADRDAYTALKQHLAGREWPDLNAYVQAKSSLIGVITERAEVWAASTGWVVSQQVA